MASNIPKLKPPQPNPHNIQATKRYVFNETGNIMLASTDIASDQIQQDVRDIFAEVAVFFAAMTKAISLTIDPKTNQPYSLYDYKALRSVIDGSGLFIHVTQEQVEYSSTSFGMTFSKELIEAILGLATGAGEMGFAQAMIASMGNRGLTIGGKYSKTDSRVGNIVFVCEYLLGMPVVSAIVVNVDSKKFQQQFQIGPCFKESSTSITMDLIKDTYMFVTPKFIKEYAGDLLSVESDLQFAEFVDYLQDIVERKPVITTVDAMSGDSVDDTLTANETYAIVGIFLTEKLPVGATSGILKFTEADPYGGNGKIINAQWQDEVVTFGVTGSRAAACPIGLYADAASTTPFLTTPGSYMIIDPTGPQFDNIFEKGAVEPLNGPLRQGSQYSIIGANFGPQQGTGNLLFADTTLGGAVTVNSWADGEIDFTLTTPFTSSTDSTELVIKTATGGVAVTGAVSATPALAPIVGDVTLSAGGAVPSDTLNTTDTYEIVGANFGTTQSASDHLDFADPSLGGALQVHQWGDTKIVFTLQTPFSHPATGASAVKVTTIGGSASSPTKYKTH